MASAKLSMSKADTDLQKQLEAYKQHSEISRCSLHESIELFASKGSPYKARITIFELFMMVVEIMH